MDVLGLVCETAVRNATVYSDVPVLAYHASPQRYIFVPDPHPAALRVAAIEMNAKVALAPANTLKKPAAAGMNKSKRVVWRGFDDALLFTRNLKLKSAGEWKVSFRGEQHT